MKKLLSILGSIGLVATSSMMVVSCGIGENDQNIDPVLQEQNFRVLNDLNVGENLFNRLGIKDEDFFYSDGLNNKFIDNKLTSINGSFNASDFSLINLIIKKLNTKSNINQEPLKIKVEKHVTYDQTAVNPNTISTQGQLRDLLKLSVTGTDELKQLTVDNIEGTYKENGKPISPDDSSKDANQTPEAVKAKVLSAFNNLVNLGNTEFWNKDGKPAWENMVNYIENSNGEFSNTDYTKTVTIKSDDSHKIKIVQLIKLSNTGVLINNLKDGDSTNALGLLKADADKYFKGDVDKSNEFMNEAFSYLNIFSSHYQTYAASAEVDSNYLRDQLLMAHKDAAKIANKIINKSNEQIIGKFFVGNYKNETTQMNTLDVKSLSYIGANDSTLKTGDFIFNNFGVANADDLTKKLDGWVLNSSITLEGQNPNDNKKFSAVSYSANQTKYIEQLGFGLNPDQTTLKNKIDTYKENALSTVFTSKLNDAAKLANDLSINFVMYLTMKDGSGKTKYWNSGNNDGALSFTTTGIDFLNPKTK